MHSALNTLWHHFIPSHHNAYRPHILRRPWLLFFLSLALAIEGFLVANLLVRQSSEVFLAAVVPSEIIALTNAQRAQYHTRMLIEDSLLTQAAHAKAEDMANKGYFAHVGPGGVEPWSWIKAAGYDYSYAGENLAVQFEDSSEVVKAWMESPTHRANIVKSSYSAVGVGMAKGTYEGQPAVYIVQYFASPYVAVGQSASVGSAQTSWRAFVDMLQRYYMRVISDPYTTAMWVLGSLAVVLFVAVTLCFFVHIQIQSTAMLASGTALALFAVSLIAINAHFLRALPSSASPASVLYAQSSTSREVVIDPHAASVQR